jgi:hypothetical protein
MLGTLVDVIRDKQYDDHQILKHLSLVNIIDHFYNVIMHIHDDALGGRITTSLFICDDGTAVDGDVLVASNPILN